MLCQAMGVLPVCIVNDFIGGTAAFAASQAMGVFTRMFLIFCGTVQQKNVKIEIITVSVTTHDRIFR